jgi:hypothetical protein
MADCRLRDVLTNELAEAIANRAALGVPSLNSFPELRSVVRDAVMESIVHHRTTVFRVSVLVTAETEREAVAKLNLPDCRADLTLERVEDATAGKAVR